MPLERRTGQYVDSVIEEIEFNRFLDWPRLEESFGKTRKQIQAALLAQGRDDLIRSVHRNTYGAIYQPDIASIVNREGER